MITPSFCSCVRDANARRDRFNFFGLTGELGTLGENGAPI